MFDELKRHPEKIPLYLVIVVVALIGWPFTLALIVCGVVMVIMDEVLHLPKWATAIVLNILFVGGLILFSYWTGINLSTSGDLPPCSKPGC